MTSVTLEEELEKELREVLAKPDEWYLKQADRALKGGSDARRRHVRVSGKG
jgi:hypothetical protein